MPATGALCGQFCVSQWGLQSAGIKGPAGRRRRVMSRGSLMLTVTIGVVRVQVSCSLDGGLVTHRVRIARVEVQG